MQLDLISKYRTQLMGIAILWVMFYHSPLSITFNSILSQFKNMGYGGVDLFMFLSGFGIYYSLTKSHSIKEFYTRRLWRILPYYIPIALISSLFSYTYGNIDISTVILNVFALSYWFGIDGHFEWFIPTILFFYLISPCLYKLLNRYRIASFLTILAIDLLLFFLIGGSDFSYLLLAVGRFPMYLSGMWFGRYIQKNKQRDLSTTLILLFAALLILGIFLWNYLFTHYWGTYWNDTLYGFLFIPYWVMTFPICLFSSYFLSLLKNYKYPILTFFGINTLIFYILHERIMHILHFYDIPYITVIAFILTITLGILWKKVVDLVVSKLHLKTI